MRILWHIIHGENRFSELEKALSGISEKVLYTSLRELEEAEILVRKVEHRILPQPLNCCGKTGRANRPTSATSCLNVSG